MRIREEWFRLPIESEVHVCKASRVNVERMAARCYKMRSGEESDVGQALIGNKRHNRRVGLVCNMGGTAALSSLFIQSKGWQGFFASPDQDFLF